MYERKDVNVSLNDSNSIKSKDIKHWLDRCIGRLLFITCMDIFSNGFMKHN